MRQLTWLVIGKPLAALGGRSFAEMQDATAAQCDKSIAVGLLLLVSVVTVFCGHWRFWHNLGHVGEAALPLAAAVAAVLAVVYRVVLRGIETMHAGAKTLTLSCLAALMLVNASLAGHELVIFAFRPQVDQQMSGATLRGITEHTANVDKRLDLPALHTQVTELMGLQQAALTERDRLPETVRDLQQQASRCAAMAARLRDRMPADPLDPAHASAERAWHQQRVRCDALTSQADKARLEHRVSAERQLKDVQSALSNARSSLGAAQQDRARMLQHDTATIISGTSTGFARHKAMWEAVEAKTVPAWAAIGLMFWVVLFESLCFLYKLLAADDTATLARKQAAGQDLLFARMVAEMQRQGVSLVKTVARSQQETMKADLNTMVREAIAPMMLQELDERAIARAASAYERTRDGSQTVQPSMVARLVTLMCAARQRRRRMPAGQGMAA